MRITQEEVLHIARLAEIEVAPHELAPLSAQLDRIVDYVGQLEQAAEAADPSHPEPPAFVPGPVKVALRDDVVRPEPLAIPPAELAPEWKEGYFVVPRLGGMEEP